MAKCNKLNKIWQAKLFKFGSPVEDEKTREIFLFGFRFLILFLFRRFYCMLHYVRLLVGVVV